MIKMEDDNLSETVPLLFANDDEPQNISDLRLALPPTELSVNDVVCVFIVAFDSRTGNYVQWSLPDGVDLEGVEFKAITSGSHNITTDVVYFRKGKLFGLSCFENIRVESDIERGVRMRSVGVLTASYSNINNYRKILQTQIRRLLEHPYEELQQFYLKYKGVGNTINDQPALSIKPTPQFTCHTINCYSQFVAEFKEQVFILWKCLLLRKRILFFSQPPIEFVCQKVYCANCLSFQNVPEMTSVQSANVLFFINVADIELVESTNFYIACTTDTILELKPHLSDVHIFNSIVSLKDEELQNLITVTSADRARYNTLTCMLKECRLFQSADSPDEHSIFILFFTELNNRLFRGLYDASYTPEKLLLNEDVAKIGLDPYKDRSFLLKLLQVYNINVSLENEKPCCPPWTT